MTEKGKAVVEYRSQGGVDISLTPDTVRNFLVQGRKDLVSAQELMYFMNVCRARKLNPFIKDCYLIKYGSDPAAIVTSVDYFRKNARKAPDCKGWKAGVIVLQDGEITYREGSLKLDNETLVGGWAEAKPEGWNEPKRHTINLAGYIKKTKDGKVTRFWQPERQPDMIAKVAESQLLRQLWGEETTGMYSVEEMPSVEDIKQTDGPVQSEIKQRIMDGKKQQDPEPLKPPMEKPKPISVVKTEDPAPDEPKPKEKISEKVGVPSNAMDEYQANVDKNIRKIEDPAPDEPKIKPPVTDELTEDQVIATEKSFALLCNTVNVAAGEAYEYLEHLKAISGMEYIDLMRRMIENEKTEFADMRDWLKANKEEAPQPEKSNGNGKRKKRVPLKDLESKSKAWAADNWSKLKSTGFSTYVWKNIGTLSGEPEALQKAVRKKWKKLFKDEFPVPGANKLNGNGNEPVIEAEVVHDPNGQGKNSPDDIPDKENNPDEYIKWLRGDFPEEFEGAIEYLGHKGRMVSGMTMKEKAELIQRTEQLIDMNA